MYLHISIPYTYIYSKSVGNMKKYTMKEMWFGKYTLCIQNVMFLLSGVLFYFLLTLLFCHDCDRVCSYSELEPFNLAVQRLFNFNCSLSRGQFMMARAEQESFTDPLKFEDLLFTLPQASIPTLM